MIPAGHDEHECTRKLRRATTESVPLISGRVVAAKVVRCLRSNASSEDPMVALGFRDRGSWRRIDRWLVADHQRRVANSLRRLAAARVAVLATVPALTDAQASGPLAGLVGLAVPGWQLILTGVAPGPRTALASVAGRGLQLSGAGRYGMFWWIEVACTGGTHRQRVMLLGSDLLMRPADGPGSQGIHAMPYGL